MSPTKRLMESIGLSFKVTPWPITNYSIEIYRTPEEAKDDWNHLEEMGECFAFQTYIWISAWIDLIGSKRSISPYIVVLRAANGEAAMLIPLGIRREHGLYYLSFLAHEMSDYQGPLIARAFAEDLASNFKMIWPKILEELPPIDMINFRRMPETMGSVPNPFVHLDRAEYRERAYSSPLPEKFQDYLKHPKRKKIHGNCLRNLRRLREIGHVAFEQIRGEEKIEKVIEVLSCQKGPKYVQALGFNWLERTPEVKTFYRRIASSQSGQFRGHVAIMTIEDNVISTHVGMVFRDRFYMILPSYAGGDWYRYSPGLLLMEYLIETSIKEGCTIYDMTVGDEDYKKNWTETVLRLYTLKQPLSLRAEVFHQAIVAKDKLKRRIKNVEWIRCRVISLRDRVRHKRLTQAQDAARLATGKLGQIP